MHRKWLMLRIARRLFSQPQQRILQSLKLNWRMRLEVVKTKDRKIFATSSGHNAESWTYLLSILHSFGIVIFSKSTSFRRHLHVPKPFSRFVHLSQMSHPLRKPFGEHGVHIFFLIGVIVSHGARK